MDASAEAEVEDLLDWLPWKRAPHSLLTPLVELVAGEKVLYRDARVHEHPRSYGSVIVLFTTSRVLVHTVRHQLGDRQAQVSTRVLLRKELVGVTSDAEPETPYGALERFCDWLLTWWTWAGSALERMFYAVALRWPGFRRWYPISLLEAPRERCVDLRYEGLPEPLRLPMHWSDTEGHRPTFDAFLPELLHDLP